MYKVQINQLHSKIINRQGLRIDNVHATLFSLGDVLLLNMAGDSNNTERFPVVVLKYFPYSLDCLVAVHEWHHAVGKNEGVPVGIAFVNCFLHMLNQLLSIVAAVNPRFDVLHP